MKRTTKGKRKVKEKMAEGVPNQFYKKVNGRYKRVPQFPSEPAEGLWIVQKHKGSTSYRQLVKRLSELPSDLVDLTKLELRRDDLSRLLLKILDGSRVMSVNDMVSEMFKVLTDDNKIQINTNKPQAKIDKNRIPIEMMWRLVGKVIEFEYCVPSIEVNERSERLNNSKLREKKTGMVRYHDGVLKRISVNDGYINFHEEDIDLKTIRILPPEEEIVWKLEHEGRKRK